MTSVSIFRNARRGLAIVIALFAAWMLYEVLIGGRMTWAQHYRAAAVALIVGVYALAALAAWSPSPIKQALVRRVAIGVALLIAARSLTRYFVAQPIFSVRIARADVDAMASLRVLVAAQEQYRLLRGRYADSLALVTSVAPMEGLPTEANIVARGDSGWRAEMTVNGHQCAVFVRLAEFKSYPAQSRDVPYCVGADTFATAMRPDRPSAFGGQGTGFAKADVFETWPFHRSDAARQARVGRRAAVTWTSHVDGPIRSSPSVAGNQIFVGSHGSGELSALTLDSGRLGWRVRAPNWIHHEPAIGEQVIAVGYGDNRHIDVGDAILPGGPPSGVAVFDRLTGRLRWDRRTWGSVMTTPVLWNSLVIVVTSAGEAVAWTLADGSLKWRAALPGPTFMGNLLVRDSLLVIGLEPTQVCVLIAATGTVKFCTEIQSRFWGAGHASPALSGNTIIEAIDATQAHFLSQLSGLPVTSRVSVMWLVGLDAETGQVRWHTPVQGAFHSLNGHIAGTPVIVDGRAFVTLPTVGVVVALDVGDGRLVWSREIEPTRGSVSVLDGRVFSATRDGKFVVLDARTGRELCRAKLAARSDRAGLTVAGASGVLVLDDGTLMMRPVADWLSCNV